MTGLSETLSTLARYRRNIEQAAAAARFGGAALTELAEFGVNPGDLRMFTYAPAALPRNSPLVVVLHGCTQTASAYDAAAGWSTLAERFGFMLLLPEQRRQNNSGGCFNWFQPNDTTRGQGEAASVRAMVHQAVSRHGVDPRRVYITGLSAGGAFANAMLATYPEVFAGGAIIAGLPYGGAHDLPSAMTMMRAGQQRSDQAWGDLVRAASPHRGPWPRVQVWHGGADTTVAPVNGTGVVRQWLNVHGHAYAAAQRERVGAAEQCRWGETVALYTLPRLGHAVPIGMSEADPARRCGTAGPFATDCGLSSSYLIARSWRLTDHQHPDARQQAPRDSIVQRALRAAGLL